MLKPIVSKTYKRETAISMLLFLGFLFVYGVFWAVEPAIEAAKFLTFPIFGWSAAAFALDWRTKQYGP